MRNSQTDDRSEQQDREQADPEVLATDLDRLRDFLFKFERGERSTAPEIGDLYLFDLGIEQMIVEWLIVGRAHPNHRKYYLVVVTSGLKERRQDIAVAANQQGGPTIVRPDFGLWIDSAQIEQLGQWSGSMNLMVVRKTRERIASIHQEDDRQRPQQRVHRTLCRIRDRAAALFGLNQENSLMTEMMPELAPTCRSSLRAVTPQNAYGDKFNEMRKEQVILTLKSLIAQHCELHDYIHLLRNRYEERESLLRLTDYNREMVDASPSKGSLLCGILLKQSENNILQQNEHRLLQRFQVMQQATEAKGVMRLYRSMQLGYALANALILLHMNAEYELKVHLYDNYDENSKKEATALAQIHLQDFWHKDELLLQDVNETHGTATLAESMQALGRLLHKLVFESEDNLIKSSESPVFIREEITQTLTNKEPMRQCERLTNIYQRCWILVNRLSHLVEDELPDIFAIVEELAYIKLALVVVMSSQNVSESETHVVRMPQCLQKYVQERSGHGDVRIPECTAFTRNGFLEMKSPVPQPENEQRVLPLGLRYQN